MKNISKYSIVYFVLLLTILCYRFWIILVFNAEYIDSDQAIMWSGTKDFSAGNFHETRFYGQNYNTMFEALLSSIFSFTGLKYKYLLPSVTTILSITPFIILSWLTFKKKSKNAGLIILSLVLLMPLEYDLITTLPRGFVTGIFLFSFVFPFLFSKNQLSKSFFWISFLLTVAFTFNANTILISFVILFYYFLKYYSNKTFYYFSFLGFLVGGIVIFGLNIFYYFHPNYVLHENHIDFNFNYLVEGIKHLDLYFNDVTPIFWNKGWMIVLLFYLLAFILFRKNKNLFIVCVVFPFVLILTFMVSKVHDGTASIFFSYSRMYLCIPLIFAFIISCIDFKKFIGIFFTVLSFVLLVLKVDKCDLFLKNCTNSYSVVNVVKVKDLENECKYLKRLTQKNDVDLLVVINDDYYDFINYGCECLENEFPRTVRPIYERRTWRLIEDENKAYSNILFLDNTLELDTNKLNLDLIDVKRGYFLLKKNSLSNKEIYRILNITCRSY